MSTAGVHIPRHGTMLVSDTEGPVAKAVLATHEKEKGGVQSFNHQFDKERLDHIQAV